MVTHVLVVGAGPTGLTLACELYRHGVPCRIVDQRTVHVDRSRAVDVQSRTLHVFDDMGVARELLARGRVLRGLSVYDGSKRLAHIAYRADDTPFPFAVSVPQTETELVLERRLESLGGRVERGVQLRRLRVEENGVEVALSEAGSESVTTAGYVIGCDGIASAVRDCEGIAFEPRAAAQSFATADATIHWSFPRDELALFLSDSGCLLALPLPGEGRMRLIANTDAGSQRPLDLEAFAQMASGRLGSDVQLHEPGFVGTYHVQRRLAETFRSDRVLLAGDAAHSFNPVGGHGMNQGIQDAYNLGWKLALVVRGSAGDEVLDSYAVERRGVAEHFAREMDFGARLLLSEQLVAREERDRLLDFAVRSPTVRRAVLDAALPHLSVYADSPITSEVVVGGYRTPAGLSAGSCAPDVRLGDRAQSVLELLRGTEHALLLLAGADAGTFDSVATVAREVTERWGQLVRVSVAVEGGNTEATWSGDTVKDPDGALHRRYGASSACAYLIRPDGHIAFRSCPLQGGALRGYLNRLFPTTSNRA